jgi:hypothetical protein
MACPELAGDQAGEECVTKICIHRSNGIILCNLLQQRLGDSRKGMNDIIGRNDAGHIGNDAWTYCRIGAAVRKVC